MSLGLMSLGLMSLGLMSLGFMPFGFGFGSRVAGLTRRDGT